MLNRYFHINIIQIILPLFILFACTQKDDDIVDTYKKSSIVYLENQRIDRFDIVVNTSNPMIPGDPVSMETQKGLIMLPIGYSSNGKTTKTIIYCHSGSGTVTETYSEAENDNYCKYFVSLGYAVMDVAAMPKTYTDRLKIDYGRTLGSFVAIRSYMEGYKYVLKNYNVDPKGCYIFSNSSGGLVSLNLGNLTSMKVYAQAGICPLLSIEKNAWHIATGALNTGEFSEYQLRANTIRIYGMQNVKYQYELNVAIYEKEKVGIYDPYDFIINLSDKPYRIPYKIFQPKNDGIVSYKIAEKLVQVDSLRGGNMILRSFETGGHTPEPNKVNVGEYVFMNKTYYITPTLVEVAQWFELNGGYKIPNSIYSQ